jgi:hypothetical protein
MHNCKNAKEALMEAALQRWIPMPDEFAACPHCREEFDSLRSTLQMTDAALQLAQPREKFWMGYDARLRRRLTNNEQPASRSQLRSFASVLRLVATASVPVPAPLALALFSFLVFSTFFLLHSRTSSNGAPTATLPTVVTKTIEVPVIQEKQVTRVIYRDQRAARLTAPATLQRNTTVATRRDEAPPESLDGFKPVPEAKLILIKGNRDEK